MNYEIKPNLDNDINNSSAISKVIDTEEIHHVIFFVKEEIETSCDLINFIVRSIGMEVENISEFDSSNHHENSTFRILECLQYEDRVQQRLQDIIRTLQHLQEIFRNIDKPRSERLSEDILGCLLLEEMQNSFASIAKMGVSSPRRQPAPSPSLGEIDLF